MNPQRPEDFREAVQRVETLYSICQVLGRILKLVRKPDASMSQIAEVVAHDQALAADVLHLSNCALFRRGAPCTRLSEALQRLGVNELIRLIGISLSKNLFGKDLACYGMSASQYWTEAVWCALCNEAGAHRLGLDPSEAYVVGLLSPMGKALINEVVTAQGWNVLWDGLQPLPAWERSLIGFTHAEAGALLMRRWDFPDTIVHPILSQLETPDASPAIDPVGLIRVTRACASALDPAQVRPQSRANVPEAFGAALGFDQVADFRAFLETLTTRVDEIRASLAEG